MNVISSTSFSFLLWLIIHIFIIHGQNVTFIQSECISYDDLVYANNGVISITQTLIKCLQHINDPLIFPGYFYNPPYPFNVYAQVALNDLVEVNEVQETVTIDFIFRLYWTDPRLNMTAFWKSVPNQVVTTGIDLAEVLGVVDINGAQPGIWVPDVYFPDAVSVDSGAYLLTLHPLGYVEWSRYITLTILQTSLEFKDYPSDTQELVIRFNSYGLNSSYLLMNPVPEQTGGYVVLLQNYEGEHSFEKSPIWSYVDAFGQTNLEVNGVNRYRSTAVIYVTISRISLGLVTRLGMPICLLAILAGQIFWAPRDKRFDATVTILLAVSALYIVIFQNIPMLGYLTKFDEFAILMYFILFVSTVAHGIVQKLEKKKHMWPMREFTVRLIESIGRVCIIPICVLLFFKLFQSVYSYAVASTGIAVGAIVAVTVVTREFFGLLSSYRTGINSITEKVKNLDTISSIETLLFNMYYYKRISLTLRHHNRITSTLIGKQRFEMKAKQTEILVTQTSTSQNSVNVDIGGNDNNRNENDDGRGVRDIGIVRPVEIYAEENMGSTTSSHTSYWNDVGVGVDSNSNSSSSSGSNNNQRNHQRSVEMKNSYTTNPLLLARNL